jgi:ribosome-binding ATPase YchF (GTP1/OBG family)
VLLKCQQALEQQTSIRQLSFTSAEEDVIHSFQFLAQKPLFIILNTGEGQNSAPPLEKIRALFAGVPLTLVTAICGKLEMELAQLEAEEQAIFMKELGLKELALTRFISESFQLLGLIVFFTIGDDEVRAWTITKGSTALKAAGTIHSDLERGFIRAEVFHFQDILEAQGSQSRLKEAGKIRLEGKDYIVQDGDIISVRFHVKK